MVAGSSHGNRVIHRYEKASSPLKKDLESVIIIPINYIFVLTDVCPGAM